MGFGAYRNTSTPFPPKEHNVIWKSERRYHDFVQSNDYLDKCEYPRFWSSLGRQVANTTDYCVGCRDSKFDQVGNAPWRDVLPDAEVRTLTIFQYGEVASFGDYQDYERQLSKFAFEQDRLREWWPSALAKIEHFSCMAIAMLDIDGYRIDEALQVTFDAQDWECERLQSE